MKNLVYIMGKSSSGKDTIYKKLKDRINVNSLILYTTRPIRKNEENGKDYYFMTKEQFEYLEKKDRVIEARHYSVINSNGENDIWTYATMDDNQWNREGIFVTIGTLKSYNSILEYSQSHPEKEINVLPVYINIDENERRSRAEIRESEQENPNFEEMERRLKADNIDFSEKNLKKAKINKDNTFENYNLEDCVNKIVNYIEANTREKEDDCER